MTIWEISEKADYIAQRHQQLQDQWHLYCNSLIQGITLSKARLHHAMSCTAQGDMRFVLFGHFTIFVTLAESFNSHTIEYYVETKEGEKQCIAKAQLMADGMVDGHVIGISPVPHLMPPGRAKRSALDRNPGRMPGAVVHDIQEDVVLTVGHPGAVALRVGPVERGRQVGVVGPDGFDEPVHRGP